MIYALVLLLFQQGGVPNKPKGPLEALRPKLQVATSTHIRCMIVYSVQARAHGWKKPQTFFIVWYPHDSLFSSSSTYSNHVSCPNCFAMSHQVNYFLTQTFPHQFRSQPTQQNARARRTSYASADSDGTPPFLYYLIGNLSAFIFPVCTIDDCFFPPSVADTLNLSPEDLVPQGEPSQQGEPVEDKNKE